MSTHFHQHEIFKPGYRYQRPVDLNSSVMDESFFDNEDGLFDIAPALSGKDLKLKASGQFRRFNPAQRQLQKISNLESRREKIDAQLQAEKSKAVAVKHSVTMDEEQFRQYQEYKSSHLAGVKMPPAKRAKK
jgi:hypothetical protein